MTRPTDWLTPQPDPVPTERSASVTDWLLERLAEVGADPVVAELVRARREQCRERYGTELMTHTGRDVVADRVQEAVDLMLYTAQDQMEGTYERPGNMWAMVALIERLAARMEER